MNWLTPAAGFILAACLIPPLILLYFLKLRRRTQNIASTLLWQRSVQDLRANAPFQKLRASLLLFLQLLALILFAISIMQPQIQAGEQQSGKTVMLIDNSASMTATDLPDGQSRLDRAKELASERIEAMYAGGLFGSDAGETMIVSFASPERAQVMTKFTGSKQKLLTAIERIRPTHGQTSIEQALTLARAYTTIVDPDMPERPVDDPATVEIYSDGRIHDLNDQVQQVHRGETIEYFPIGRAPEDRPADDGATIGGTSDNISIVSIAVERPYDRPTAVEVFAGLRSHLGTSVEVDVQLSVDGVALYVETVEIGPATEDPATGDLAAEPRNIIFTPFEQPRGAVIEVALLRPDVLEADNAARVVVPPPKQLQVALVTRSGGAYRHILEGMALRGVTRMTPEIYEIQATDGSLEDYDVVVFDDYAPERAELMPPGRYLCFGPAPPIEGLNDYGEGGRQIVLNSQDSHPALRFVSFDALYVPKCRLLEPRSDIEILAEGSNTPLIVSVSRGPMQVLYVTFDPMESRWPISRGFVTFVFNSIEYLGHVGEALTSEGFQPGDALTARIHPNATNVSLLTPEGTTERPSVGEGGEISWGPIRETGVYVLACDEPGMDDPVTREFAVNLLDVRESDVAPIDVITLGEDRVVGRVGEGNAYTPLWPWALAICLVLLTVEWWIYHRAVYL